MPYCQSYRLSDRWCLSAAMALVALLVPELLLLFFALALTISPGLC